MSNTSQKEKRSILSANPVMRRLNKVEERAEDNCATYGGITAKTIFFLLFSVAGILVQRFVEPRLTTGESFPISINGFEVNMFIGETIALLAVVVAAIVFQILAFFVKGSTPVTGALYCLTQGYFISFLVFKVLGAFNMQYLGLLALVITMLIIVIMAVLYSTGVIRVNKKFKMVMLTLVFTTVAASLLMFIASFIPFTSKYVALLRNNLPLSIAVGVIFIIIAALFLICDFDTIDHVVNDKLPKKYEWHAAFGLSFTVLWLYLKVLDLIMTIAGSKRS